MALKLKEIAFPKGTKLTEVLKTDLRYLSNEIRKINNIEKSYVKLFLDVYDMPIEIEVTGQLPKDLNKYDKVELVNSELLIKPKAGGSGQFISSELVISGVTETIAKDNGTPNKPVK